MKKRIIALREKMKELSLDGFLVSNFYNISYISGFTGLSAEERECWLLVTHNNCYVFTDARYEEEVKKTIEVMSDKTWFLKLLTTDKKLISHLAEIVLKDNLHRVGFEGDDLTFAEYAALSKHISLTPTQNVVISLRAYKDADEIKKIIKACDITSACMAELLPFIRPGISEIEIAKKIEQYLIDKNLDTAFYPIVAADQNAAHIHYDTKTNGNTKIRNKSMVLIDFGLRYKNYLSDMTRMVFVGKPSSTLVNAYGTLLECQQSTIEQLNHETNVQKIDAYCRKYLVEKKYPGYPHSTGHGVGMQIHEYPKISAVSPDVLRRGNVVTIEPGIYVPQHFGMRIEDTVVLKDDKTPEVLTTFSKEMVIVKP